MGKKSALFEENIMDKVVELKHSAAEFYGWYKNNFIDAEISFTRFQEDCLFCSQYGVFVDFFKSWIEQKEDNVLKMMVAKMHCLENDEAKRLRILSCFEHINFQLSPI